MRPSPYLLATSALLTLLGQSAAHAETFALSFDLPPAKPTQPAAAAPDPAVAAAANALAEAAAAAGELPLPVPAAAANPPISRSGQGTLPSSSFGGGDAIAMADQSNPAARLLPPPPPLPQGLVAAIPTAKPEPNPLPAVDPAPAAAPETIALNFDIGPGVAEIAVAQTPVEPSKPGPSAPKPLLALFEGGSNSLVARTVGSAEGTRTADGQRTSAYFGHVDPGNGVWNLGTFSYQHGATTPEEADVRQLQRLQAQTAVIQQKAREYGLELSLQETLNAIDLANQAPLAALGRGSYVDWLAQAHKLGKTGDEAIVWARTRSFLDPDTQRWNAPGLGNNVYSISRDQERRMLAIARALEHYQGQNPAPLQTTVAAAAPAAAAAPQAAPDSAPAPVQSEGVDAIFSLDLEPSPPQPAATAPSPWQIAPGLADVNETVSPEVPSSVPTAPEAALGATPAPAAAVREGAQTPEAVSTPTVQDSLQDPLLAPPAFAPAPLPAAEADIVGAAPETQVLPPASQAPASNLHSAAPVHPLDLLFQFNV
jgi:hypothetical protein